MAEPRSLFRENLANPYNRYNVQRLYSISKGSTDLLQRLRVERKLSVHNGCVNTVCWNDSGQYLLSGSDDQHLAITNPFTGKNVVTIHSGHRANIFAAKFLPCTQDRHIISCSGDGTIFFTEVDREDTYGQNKFDCHFGTTYEVLTVPHDPNTFLSCGEDGTVRWFDLRTKTNCTKEDCKDDVLLNCRRAVTALCVNPMIPYQLGVACSDSSVRIFDRRMLGTRATGNYSAKSTTGLVARFTAPLLENRAHRVTSLQYSPDGEELLVSYSSELIYLFNMKEDGKKQLELQKESSSPDSSSPIKEDVSQEPQPSTSSGDSNEGGRQPPIKRLRLRGDWSDTGPNARPERERGEEASRSVTIMQRMSDMLTRWLDGANRSSERQEGEVNEEGGEGGVQAQAEGGEQAGVSQGTEEHAAEQQVIDPEATQQERQGVSVPEDVVVATTSENQDESLSGKQEKSDSTKRKEGEFPSSKSSTEDITSAKPAESKIAVPETADDESAKRGTADFTENIGAKHEGDLSVKTETVIDTPPQGQDETKTDDVTKIANSNTSGASKDSETAEMQNPSQQPAVEHKHKPSGSDSESSEPSSCATTTASTGISTTNVQSIRQTIQDTRIEPVISFQYHSEGTTASTISVDFQTMEGVHCLPSSSEDTRPSESDVNQTATLPGSDCQTGDNNTKKDLVSQSNQPTEISTGEDSIKISTLQKKQEATGESSGSGEQTECQIPCEVQTTQSTECQERQKSTNVPPGKTRDSPEDINQSEVTSSERENVQQPASETAATDPAERSESENPDLNKDDTAIEPSGDQDEDDSYDEFTDYDTATEEEQTEEQATEKASRGKEAPDESQVEGLPTAPQVTITAAPDPADEDDSVHPSTSQEDAEGESSNVAAASGGDSNTPTRLVTRPRGATGVSTSGRQRRIGHSGPPTGDFQLHSASDDDDDDSDSELMRAAERSRRSRDNMERNLAALRLQELYRKRQEEREKEEREMMNLKQPAVKQVFRGHRNARTMIKEANFWGEHYVMSGSDCGHIFIWNRYTGKLVMLLEGDRHVVNCVQPHPYYPVLASSGIDYDVKVWMPIAEEPTFDSAQAHEVMRRNEIMLEETRDTITVPASFMLRMLASLNNIRAGRRANQQEEEDSSSSSEDDENFANNLFNDDNNNDSNNNV